jgi:Protein of unknown function (DUF1194)
METSQRLRQLALPVLLACLPLSANAASEPVDVALVIATDVSYSVDDNEAEFQRQGAIAAFRDPDVVKAIEAGALRRIAVAYLDFSSYGSTRLVVGWHVVHDAASAEAFADALAAQRRTYGIETSISSGVELGMQLLDSASYRATKRIIDVSGDGPNNEGRRIDWARDEAVKRGIIINGLPIMTEADKTDIYYLPDLDKYYAGCVIGGPGAFVQVAKGFQDLKRAIRRKLILEISSASSRARVIPARAEGHAPFAMHENRFVYEKGCDIGERMRYGYR